MSLLSSIDIGTNSTRLLIARVGKSGEITSLRYEERITRLGEGFGEERVLNPAAIERVSDALGEYDRFITESGAVKPRIVATSAARDAVNKDEFLSAVWKATGAECRIIDGDTEARLTALGVMSDLADASDFVIIDPGGGSTEFISCKRAGGDVTVVSLDVGSRRLTERFVASDPPLKEELESMRGYLDEALAEGLEGSFGAVGFCVGVGGTATSAASIAAAASGKPADSTHGMVVSMEELKRQSEWMVSVGLTERRELKGLNPARADVITTGIIIMQAILDHFSLQEYRVSERDILFGLLIEDSR